MRAIHGIEEAKDAQRAVAADLPIAVVVQYQRVHLAPNRDAVAGGEAAQGDVLVTARP